MRDLSFFLCCMCPLTKKASSNLALVFLVVVLWGLEGSNCLLPDRVPVTRDTGGCTCSIVGGTAWCGIRVVCVTMDGHASNVHMCNQLGCNSAFVMMDACHMLKLARNMLQAYSPITSTAMDCMLPTRCQTNMWILTKKMKVSLAAQTLSRSVAVALWTLRDLGYLQFQHCEATAEFVEY